MFRFDALTGDASVVAATVLLDYKLLSPSCLSLPASERLDSYRDFKNKAIQGLAYK